LGQADTAAAHTRAKGKRPTGGLTLLIDLLGMAIGLYLLVKALLFPHDPLGVLAIVTAGCVWLAAHIISVTACGGRWWPAPPLMYFFLTVLTGQLGGFYYYHMSLWSPPEFAVKLVWMYNAAHLAIAAGVWTYARATRLSAGKLVDGFYTRPLTAPLAQDSLVLPTLLIFFIATGASFVMMGGGLPIVEAISKVLHGDFWGVRGIAMEARHSVYSSAERPGQAYLNQFRQAMVPMMVLFWFCSWRITGKAHYRWLWWSGLAATVVLLTGSLERSLVILFLGKIALTAMLLYPPRPNIRWAYGLAGGFVLLVFMSLLLGRGAIKGGGLSENATKQASQAIVRIYGPNSRSDIKVLELFPAVLEFRGGQTWLNDLRGLLPGASRAFSAEVFSYFGKGPGSASPHFIAEMWANGGWLSVIFVSWLWGIVLQWVNFAWLAMKERTPLNLTLMSLVFFCVCMPALGVWISFVPHGLLTFLMLGWVLRSVMQMSPLAAIRAAAARRGQEAQVIT
jgi:hypothetical protein